MKSKYLFMINRWKGTQTKINLRNKSKSKKESDTEEVEENSAETTDEDEPLKPASVSYHFVSQVWCLKEVFFYFDRFLQTVFYGENRAKSAWRDSLGRFKTCAGRGGDVSFGSNWSVGFRVRGRQVRCKTGLRRP